MPKTIAQLAIMNWIESHFDTTASQERYTLYEVENSDWRSHCK